MLRLALALLLLAAPLAHADGVIVNAGNEVAATPGHDATIAAGELCPGGPADCSTQLYRVLSGLAFGTIRGSLAYASNGNGVASGFAVDTLSVEYPLGSAVGGRAELVFLPRDNTTRLRFTAAELDALFACRDTTDDLRFPILGQMKYLCAPGGRIGTGAMLGEVQWDPTNGRLAARWGELAGVVNVLGAPSSMAYLRHHLNATVAIAAESVWHGSAEARTGSDHVARGRLSLDGVARTASGRWEATGRVDWRPVLFGTLGTLTDYAITSTAVLRYRFLLDPGVLVSTGVEAHADYWRDPASSIGAYDAAAGTTSIYIGATIEVRHADPP